MRERFFRTIRSAPVIADPNLVPKGARDVIRGGAFG